MPTPSDAGVLPSRIPRSVRLVAAVRERGHRAGTGRNKTPGQDPLGGSGNR